MKNLSEKYLIAATKIIDSKQFLVGSHCPVEYLGSKMKQMDWLRKFVMTLWIQNKLIQPQPEVEEKPKIKFVSPVLVVLPRKTMKDKKCYLNLNNFRGWKSIVSNIIKTQYTEELEDVLAGVKIQTPITIQFKYFKPQNRKVDTSNVCSIVDKFFCDALVVHKCIEDDDDKHILKTSYLPGGLDRENPRVEIK